MLGSKISCPDLATLRDLVLLTGIDGEWAELGNHCQFRAVSGAILNFWKSTGTVSFQGPGVAAEEFKAIFLKHRQAAAGGQQVAALPDDCYAG